MGYIVVARHGSTEMNEQGDVVRGWSDVGLSQAGRIQAERLAQWVAREFKVARVGTCDLPRARQTAQYLADLTGARAEPSAALRTVDLGELNGKPYADVKDQMAALLARWEADPNLPAPGGGETWNQFQNRAFLYLVRCLNTQSPDGATALFTHGRVCRLYAALVMNSLKPLRGPEVRMIERWEQGLGNVMVIDAAQFKICGLNLVGA